jgi:cytosine/adenosine deaminase-related metal-dependent hydrolase
VTAAADHLSQKSQASQGLMPRMFPQHGERVTAENTPLAAAETQLRVHYQTQPGHGIASDSHLPYTISPDLASPQRERGQWRPRRGGTR